MILITGGTGLIGSHLISYLLKKDMPVRALFRNEEKKQSTLEFLSGQGHTPNTLSTLEWFAADILDVSQLNEAFRGIEVVYHCAARISFDPGDYRSLRKSNIEGTANVVNTCIHHQVKKLCYVSSIATLGKTPGSIPITEKEPWNPQNNNNVYAITKYGAEMEVWRGSQEGLNCIVFNPGVVLGEGLWDQSTGKFFKAIDKGLKYYPSGSTGFVDVKDVVLAMVKGTESTIKNEKFILVGTNLSFKDLFTIIAKFRDQRPPGSEVPGWVLELLWRLDWLVGFLFRRPRKLSKASARSARTTDIFDSSKARELLDISFTPLEKTIERIANYH